MTIAQVLARAARLVERGWCQIPLATNAKGVAVNPSDKEATHFCPCGAIWRLSPKAAAGIAAIHFVEEFIGELIPDWNDAPDRTGLEVATWLASASEYAKVLRQ